MELSASSRSIRTYKPRRGRVTPRQAQALIEQRAWLIADEGPIDPLGLFPRCSGVVLEIGFGTGEATIAMAQEQPEIGIIAVDIHTPGIGDLLHRIGSTGVTNVRVIDGDALDVLAERVPEGSLAGVRSYFPDPWPKARHHKRRLVQPDHIALVARRVRLGGSWHLATDWAAYAEAMLEAFDASPLWQGGIIDRPDWRPVTRYERTGIAQGRPIVDLWFDRV